MAVFDLMKMFSLIVVSTTDTFFTEQSLNQIQQDDTDPLLPGSFNSLPTIQLHSRGTSKRLDIAVTFAKQKRSKNTSLILPITLRWKETLATKIIARFYGIGRGFYYTKPLHKLISKQYIFPHRFHLLTRIQALTHVCSSGLDRITCG